MYLSYLAFLLASVLLSSAYARPPAKPPMVMVISGGFGTCGDKTHLKMVGLIQPIAQQATFSGRQVKFIVTCFTRLRPSEDFGYFSIEPGTGKPPSEMRYLSGSGNFEARFKKEFLIEYLGREIPAGANVLVVGQSHGGWVALSIAAARLVDFLGTLDPISRTACNAKTILAAGLAGLSSKLCEQGTLAALVAAVNTKLDISKGWSINLFQTASMLQSGPIKVLRGKDVDFGKVNPKYSSNGRNPTFSTQSHQDLATDPQVWSLILREIHRRMANLDLDWPPVQSVASGPVPHSWGSTVIKASRNKR